jgi:hypothetical protein
MGQSDWPSNDDAQKRKQNRAVCTPDFKLIPLG